MWNAYPHLEGYDLACLPCLRVVRVVGELEALALPEFALGGIVGGVFGSELRKAFNVRGVVATDALRDAGSTCCDYGRTDGAGWGRSDESVAEDGRNESDKCGNGELHCDDLVRGDRGDGFLCKARNVVLYIFNLSAVLHRYQYLEANPDTQRVLNLCGGTMVAAYAIFIAMEQTLEAGANETSFVILRPR
jgi:hypothetical protein